MKKILLIPIALTALTPTISMVGCNKPEPLDITLDKYDKRSLALGKEDIPLLITQTTFDVKENHTYKFVIDMTKWETPSGFKIDHFTFVINNGLNWEGDALFRQNYEFTTNTGKKLQGQLPEMFRGNINFSEVDEILSASQITGIVTIDGVFTNASHYFLFYAYPKD